MIILNQKMVEQQELTEEDIKLVQLCYEQLFELFKEAKEEDDDVALHRIGKSIQNAEFNLQEAWKFPRDARYHRYWYRAPKCTCPIIDNDEAFGTGHNVIQANCPLHGFMLDTEQGREK